MTITDPIKLNGDSLPSEGHGERQYWRSLDQLENTPEFQEILHREFPEGASEFPDDPVSRRRFLGVVAAAVAMASLSSCRKPKTPILPYAKRPEDTLPGIPEHYATAHVQNGYGAGVVMKSSDGRPTKVEGNKLHPMSLGGTSQQMQGEVLNLYDPARSQHPVDHRPKADAGNDHGAGHKAPTMARFKAFWANHGGQLKMSQGAGLSVLMQATTSPTLLSMVGELKRAFPKAAVHTWAPVNEDEAVAGSKLAFGQAMNPIYNLDDAAVIVGFDADYLECGPASLQVSRQVATSRKLKDQNDTMSRLYQVESYYTVTGASADHRFRVRAHEVADTVMALAHELKTRHSLDLKGIDTSKFADAPWTHNGKKWIPILAQDLMQSQGRSCLIAGPNQPPAVHAVVHAMNRALDNVGKTVSYCKTPAGMTEGHTNSLKALASDIDKGKVETLVMLGVNPAYDAPADLDFATKIEEIDTTIHLGLYEDETGHLCTWHVNQAHDLEAWGDVRAYDGTVSIIQPLIAPLYGGLSALEMLALLSDQKNTNGYDLLRNYWKKTSGAGDSNFETWWARSLHDGLAANSAAAKDTPAIRWAEVATAAAAHERAPEAGKDNLEVQFRADYCLADGRYSNNAWMQEVPDPMHKLTWDNAALMSRKTAEDLGVWNEDVVKLTLDGRSVDAPVWIMPGHADHAVTLHLGYGRSVDHMEVARGAGFNANALRGLGAMHWGMGLKATATGGSYKLITTQNHGSMEGRPLLREGTVASYKADPEFAKKQSPTRQMADLQNAVAAKEGKTDHKTVTQKDLERSLWSKDQMPANYHYDKGYQWGMVIDLNACTGCNACVVACQAENNIPTVGKDQVAVGRAMHWNRLDRYFSYDNSAERGVKDVPPRREVPKDDNPQALHMMVPCQQCEKAPCEVVCPVAATTHTPEGLNDMVYNRCIGTRYCSNNCPYKVRRFNYFNFHKNMPETMKMVSNPDVTVRSRGVMEKCTYCVQRINGGKLKAKLDKRPLKDGEVVTACAQACPTDAIAFGDILNPDAQVKKLKDSNRNYAMLSEMNTWPRTTYLAKIRNPNPELV